MMRTSIISVILILMMLLPLAILLAFQFTIKKIGTGLMIMFGMGRTSGQENATSTDPDSAAQRISCTDLELLGGTKETITHTTGNSYKISKEHQRNMSTSRPGSILYVIYPDASKYDIDLIWKYKMN